jgi:hypothetical protein
MDWIAVWSPKYFCIPWQHGRMLIGRSNEFLPSDALRAVFHPSSASDEESGQAMEIANVANSGPGRVARSVPATAQAILESRQYAFQSTTSRIRARVLFVLFIPPRGKFTGTGIMPTAIPW